MVFPYALGISGGQAVTKVDYRIAKRRLKAVAKFKTKGGFYKVLADIRPYAERAVRAIPKAGCLVMPARPKLHGAQRQCRRWLASLARFCGRRSGIGFGPVPAA